MADTATTAAPIAKTSGASTSALPFTVASRMGSRFAFDTGIVALATGAPTNVAPIAIPAVGFLKYIDLEVTATFTGASALTADAPFNVIQSIGFRTAGGNDLITPVTGYQLYLINKYGGYRIWSDARMGRQYSATTAGAHFFLRLPFEIDPETALGVIPAMASNRSYMCNIQFAAATTVATGATAATVRVYATSWYWHEPPATGSGGVQQQTEPDALGTIPQWQVEQAVLSPGAKLVRLNNVGSIARSHIFVLRNASNARIDTNGWGTETQLYLDNDMIFSLPLTSWEQYMTEWFGWTGATKDAALGLDTGVFVLPWHTLAGSEAGDPANTRSQLLATLNASLVQIWSTWGSAVATLETLTASVIPPKDLGFRAIYNK